jgi:hypothetical protein
MEAVLILVLLLVIGYLVYDETLGEPIGPLVARGRLCDYTAAGGVYEPLAAVLARGARLYEAHIYSDEQDHPVVASTPAHEGGILAEESISFEQLCVDIANDAFPSKDPFILSLVLHTEKAVTANECAHHLLTTVRRHLISTEGSIARMSVDGFANHLLLVSGGTVRGTDLEPLINLSWSGEDLRRLSLPQAVHPRDEPGLLAYTRDHIALVAPDTGVRSVNANPARPAALGCQWNLYDRTGGGFVEKPAPLRSKFRGEQAESQSMIPRSNPFSEDT